MLLTLYQVMSFSFLFVIRKLLKQYLSIVSLNSVSKRKWEEKKKYINFRQKEVALIKGLGSRSCLSISISR